MDTVKTTNKSKMETQSSSQHKVGMVRSLVPKRNSSRNTAQPRISSSEAETRIQNNKRVDTTLNSEIQVDTGADTWCIAGRGFSVLEYTDRHLIHRGYSDRSDEQERVPVITAATAVSLDDGTTIILVIHEALYHGEGQHTSLLNQNWIETTNEDYIPFLLQGKSSLLYVRVPTEWEKENCEHITLTLDEPWDPTSED
jgi:hypothetical protein